MSHLFEFQQIRAVLDVPYLEKIDVAVPTNLKCGNCSEEAVERLHELGYLLFEGSLQSLSGEGHSPGAVAGSGAPTFVLEPNRGAPQSFEAYVASLKATGPGGWPRKAWWRSIASMMAVGRAWSR